MNTLGDAVSVAIELHLRVNQIQGTCLVCQRENQFVADFGSRLCAMTRASLLAERVVAALWSVRSESTGVQRTRSDQKQERKPQTVATYTNREQ